MRQMSSWMLTGTTDEGACLMQAAAAAALL